MAAQDLVHGTTNEGQEDHMHTKWYTAVVHHPDNMGVGSHLCSNIAKRKYTVLAVHIPCGNFSLSRFSESAYVMLGHFPVTPAFAFLSPEKMRSFEQTAC